MNRLYELLVRWTLHRRRLLLAVIVVTTVVLGFFASQIAVKMNFKDLLSPNAPVMRAYDRMRANYPYSSSVFVVLEGKDTAELTKVGDALAGQLQEDKEWISDVQWREDMDFFRKHSLILQKPADLQKMETDLADHPQMLAQIFSGFNLGDLLAGTNASLSDYDSQSSVKSDESNLVRNMSYYQAFLAAIASGVNGTKDTFLIDRSLTDLLTDPTEGSLDSYVDDEGRLISRDGTVALMQLISQGDGNDAAYAMQLTSHLRDVIAPLQQGNPSVKIGLTGMPVLGSDEADSMMHNLILGFLIALVGILLVFFVGFRRLLVPVSAAIPLVVGVIWSIGVTSITVGELNLFSLMAPVILLGLGIDYAIHIIAKYTENRAAGMPMEEALMDVFHKIGRGLAVGALTTSAAFFAITIAGFKGMNDFGIVGGISVLGAFLSMIMVFPFLLTAFDRRLSAQRKSMSNVTFGILGPIADLFRRSRYIVAGGLVVLIVLGVFSISRLQIEKDILKIEPKGLESIRLQHLILDKFNFSIYTSYAMLDSLDSLYRKAQALEAKPTVKRTESLADILPSPSEQQSRREIINAISPAIAALSPSVDRHVDRASTLTELADLKKNLFQLKTLAYMSGLTRLVSAIEKAEGELATTVTRVQTATEASISAVNGVVYQKLQLEYQSLVDGTHNLAVARADIPSVYLDRFQGKDGSYLITIYPSEYVWTAQFTEKYLADLHAVVSDPTGMVPIWGEVIAKMIPGMLRATGAVLVVLAVLLIIDLRKVRRAVAILVPLLLSLFFTLALLPALGMKLNIVNIMALPLVLGIGIDDGVHLYHRYLVEGRIRRTFVSTGKAITMTTLTTIMAMMSLVFSSHRGMISFAWVASIGVALCLALDLLLLPILIDLFENDNKEN